MEITRMSEPMGLGRLLALTDDPAPVFRALDHVMDPELGTSIVDLGLVYDVTVTAGMVRVVMTTTTPACPIGSYLEDQVRWAVLDLPGIADVEVVLTHDPVWTPERMTPAARAMLGMR